jgi:co-chaperonin GroES (HSP10)
MQSDSYNHDASQSLLEAFPDVDPGIEPLGARVLIQLRRVADKTASGIVLVEDTKETVKWNTQVARVTMLGSLAFRNRESAAPWKEGMWVKVGDFVRAPRWGGDRYEVPVKDSSVPVVFVIFSDFELIAKVTGDPLKQRAYIL